jgi:hypothetical protein
MVQGVVKAVDRDMQAGVGSPWVSGTERVELLYGAIGVDDGERARRQSQSLDAAALVKQQLDKLAEQADSGFLAWRGVPALENGDQPVRVAGGRRVIPVGVRQQEVERWRAELQQCLIGRHGIVADVNRAKDPAVAIPEFRGFEPLQAVGDGVEAVAAVSEAAVPTGRFRVTVQADANADPQSLERLEHRAAQESAVGLDGGIDFRGHPGPKRSDEAGQPLRPGEQRLTAVQNDIDGREIVLFRMLGDALNRLVRYRRAHKFWQLTPTLVGHFIDITI